MTFIAIHDTSANNLDHDLEKTSEWVFQWNMKFNPGPTKQAQEIIFSMKKNISINTVLYFNNTSVNSTVTQSAFRRVNKTIGLSRKLQSNLRRTSLTH